MLKCPLKWPCLEVSRQSNTLASLTPLIYISVSNQHLFQIQRPKAAQHCSFKYLRDLKLPTCHSQIQKDFFFLSEFSKMNWNLEMTEIKSAWWWTKGISSHSRVTGNAIWEMLKSSGLENVLWSFRRWSLVLQLTLQGRLLVTSSVGCELWWV